MKTLCCFMFALGAAAAARGARAAIEQPAIEQPLGPSLEEVLQRTGEYVVAYEREFAGVVVEEAYVQHAATGSRFDSLGHLLRGNAKDRELKSDLLLVRPEGANRWLQFRDVYEVDGRAVRDRTDRLAKLFLQPSSSTSRQVAKINDESSRYNIGSIIRNVNVPMLALAVLLPDNQYRFVFHRVEQPDSPLPEGAWKVAFREIASGTMIRGAGDQDIPVEGYFVVDVATGCVRSTSLTAQNRSVHAKIDVAYAEDAKLGLFAPHEMTESYTQSADGATVEGHATYSNPRRFQVKVDEKIAPIIK
jgi:hypothetical protein